MIDYKITLGINGERDHVGEPRLNKEEASDLINKINTIILNGGAFSVSPKLFDTDITWSGKARIDLDAMLDIFYKITLETPEYHYTVVLSDGLVENIHYYTIGNCIDNVYRIEPIVMRHISIEQGSGYYEFYPKDGGFIDEIVRPIDKHSIRYFRWLKAEDQRKKGAMYSAKEVIDIKTNESLPMLLLVEIGQPLKDE